MTRSRQLPGATPARNGRTSADSVSPRYQRTPIRSSGAVGVTVTPPAIGVLLRNSSRRIAMAGFLFEASQHG